MEFNLNIPPLILLRKPTIIYSPFIIEHVVIEDDNFQPRKTIMSRYAKKTINPAYYQVITKTNP